ncbi:cysteine hydrolase family protein [Kutzneria buriramensis]|uniref:Nicotinamidase-related amidase n=1 Tax=Kutzneria buriramensis TaxID=1045776 RepID=A0A3E0HGH2_9PSEU|nr:cysteine hydrolase [Kutzneria buriramensis]REH44915.1 nicotinamidase-related amidase [Kutzneria buriramensis]
MRSHLAVIDMQNVFADPASQWCTPGFADIVEPVQKLVAAFRDVTFTRFVAPAKPVGAWRLYYQRWPFALQPPHAEIYQLVDGFHGATVDEITFGKWGPALARRVGDADVLVLAGVATDCCVLSTALAAADAGVVTWIVADACAGMDDEAHERALAIARGYSPHIEVKSLDEVLSCCA